jgi:hypothetical protein
MMSQYFQAYYDRPNYTADPFFNAVNPNSVKSDSDTYQIRMDHRLKEKDSLWFRYTAFNNQEVAPGTLKSSNLVNRPRTNFGGGDAYIFSPSVFLTCGSAMPSSRGTARAAPTAPARRRKPASAGLANSGYRVSPAIAVGRITVGDNRNSTTPIIMWRATPLG